MKIKKHEISINQSGFIKKIIAKFNIEGINKTPSDKYFFKDENRSNMFDVLPLDENEKNYF